MAAHSQSSPITPIVQPDQPATGWGAWLRQIAGSLNALVAWANQPVVSPTIFATLPTAPAAGTIAYVTDSTVAGFGGVIAGAGTNKVLAWYNGTAWTVIGA
jgi:hypothetical protein